MLYSNCKFMCTKKNEGLEMIKTWSICFLLSIVFGLQSLEADSDYNVFVGQRQYSIEVPGLSAEDKIKVIREVQIILAFCDSQKDFNWKRQIEGERLLKLASFIPGPGFNLLVEDDNLKMSQEAANKIVEAITISEKNPEIFGDFFAFASGLFSHNDDDHIEIFNIKNGMLESEKFPNFMADGYYVPTLFLSPNVKVYFEEQIFLGRFFVWRDRSGSLNDSLAIYYKGRWYLSLLL